tara:strand:+ start:10124 stop:10516 length:393 start_codon:yes stop_codon:yes gene_type:complete
MKSIIFTSIIILSLGFHSCCKQTAYPVAGISLTYSAVSDFTVLYDARSQKSDLSKVVDTVKVGEFNSINKYTLVVEFDESRYNHILFTSDGRSVDTISQVAYVRDKCNDIQDFEYELNGVKSTKNRITID